MTAATTASSVRTHLALALDLDDLGEAVALAGELREYFAVAKVGLQLFAASGPAAIAALADLSYEVFVDLKLHDIPTTVENAARVLGRAGARLATLHTAGGEAMLRAGVAGLAEGAQLAGLPAPVALGVTVLTSDPDAPAEVLRGRAELAERAGCGGIVCGGTDLATLAAVAPGLVRVVPGTRAADGARHDQARVVTPEAALRGGAGLLVIGRAVTAAGDRIAAAAALADALAPVVAARGAHPVPNDPAR